MCNISRPPAVLQLNLTVKKKKGKIFMPQPTEVEK